MEAVEPGNRVLLRDLHPGIERVPAGWPGQGMSYTLPWGSLNPDPDGDLAAIGSPTDALCLLDQNTAFGGGTMQSVLMAISARQWPLPTPTPDLEMHLRSLFREATEVPEPGSRARWRSPYGKFHRPANATTVQPFGKELCVVHIHTEPPFNGSAAAVDRLDRFKREKGYFPRSSALLHTMLYAIRHGYSYRYVVSPGPPKGDRYVTWVKIPQMYALLKEFRYLVVVDPDAYFAKPEVPLHLLLGRWGWKPHSSLLLAEDPPWPNNFDRFNRTTLNFGFIVAQNTPLTMRTLKELYAVPDRIKEAEIWKTNWSHEQRTFSDYLRDGFVEGEDLIIASCDDANDSMKLGCSGSYLTHLWGRKGQVNDRMLGSILRDFLIVLEDYANASGAVVNATTADIDEM